MHGQLGEVLTDLAQGRGRVPPAGAFADRDQVDGLTVHGGVRVWHTSRPPGVAEVEARPVIAPPQRRLDGGVMRRDERPQHEQLLRPVCAGATGAQMLGQTGQADARERERRQAGQGGAVVVGENTAYVVASPGPAGAAPSPRSPGRTPPVARVARQRPGLQQMGETAAAGRCHLVVDEEVRQFDLIVVVTAGWRRA